MQHIHDFSPSRSSRKSPISPVISQLMRKDKEISVLRDEISSLQIQLQKQTMNVRHYEKEIEKRDRYTQELESQCEEMDQQLQQMETAMQNQDRTIIDLEGKIKDKQSLIERIQKQSFEKLKQDDQEKEKNVKTIDDLRVEIATIKQREQIQESLKHEQSTLNNSIQKYLMQIKILEKEVLSREQQLIHIQNSEQQQLNQVQGLQKNIKDLETQIQQQNEIIDDQQQEAKTLQENLDQQSSLNQKYQNQVEDLKNELQYRHQREREVGNLVDKYQHLNMTNQGQAVQIRILEQELVSRNEMIHELQNTSENLRGQMTVFESRNYELNDHIQQQNIIILENQRLIEGLNKQIQELLLTVKKDNSLNEVSYKTVFASKEQIDRHFSSKTLHQDNHDGTLKYDNYKQKSKKQYKKKMLEFEDVLAYIFEICKGYTSISETYSLNRQGENTDIERIAKKAYLVFEKNPKLRIFVQQIECLVSNLYGMELELMQSVVQHLLNSNFNQNEGSLASFYALMLNRNLHHSEQVSWHYENYRKFVIATLRNIPDCDNIQRTRKANQKILFSDNKISNHISQSDLRKFKPSRSEAIEELLNQIQPMQIINGDLQSGLDGIFRRQNNVGTMILFDLIELSFILLMFLKGVSALRLSQQMNRLEAVYARCILRIKGCQDNFHNRREECEMIKAVMGLINNLL